MDDALLTLTEIMELCRKKEKAALELYQYNREMIAKEYETEFTIIEGYIDFSLELGHMLDSLIPQKEKPFLQFALLRIHERSVKVFREAKILLENGSGSGAMARWRTLFEFSVVANYLIKYPDLAEKYVMHLYVDDYKYARRLVRYKDRLNLYDYNMDAFPQIEAKYTEMKSKYNWDGKNNYEWAKNEDVKDPNLFTIAEAVNMEHFYAYVDEAHLYNHPSMRYLIHDRGGQSPTNEMDKALFTPFDIEVPCQLIVSSMHQVNGMALLGYINLDTADQEQFFYYSKLNKQFPNIIIEHAKKREAATNAD